MNENLRDYIYDREALHRQFHILEAFNLYTAHSRQTSVIVLFIEIFMNDSWTEPKHDNQVVLSEKLFAYQGNSITWVFFSDKMSP